MNNCKGSLWGRLRGKLLISWHPQGFEKAAPSVLFLFSFHGRSLDVRKMGHFWVQLLDGTSMTTAVSRVPTDTFNLEDVSDKPSAGCASNPSLGFVSHAVIPFQEFRVGERSGRKLFIIENHQRRAPAICAWHLWDFLLSWEPGGSQCMMWQSFWKQIWGRGSWLMWESPCQCHSLTPSPPWCFFFFPKEKKNAEVVSRSWDSIRNILGQSEGLPDFGSSPLWVITWFSLYSFQGTLFSSPFFPLIHAN